jgi:hypothetical protein
VWSCPAIILGTRATISNTSSDDVSASDGIEHGEQPGGMEMRNLAPGEKAIRY